MANVKYTPYTQHAETWMAPGGFAKFTRTCILWQICKFAYYNIKIVGIVAKGH